MFVKSIVYDVNVETFEVQEPVTTLSLDVYKVKEQIYCAPFSSNTPNLIRFT